MKGFFALAVEAARGWRPKDLKQPLTLIATADEETSMDGARLLVAAGRAPGRYAVIGEPTGLKPMRMHKGILMEALHILGRSGHSSDPALGLNAIEGMHRAIGALLDWRAELQHRHSHPGFAVSVPTLNLGRVVGGDNPNRICPECELQFDLRFLPGMDMAQLRADIHRRIGAVLDDSGYTIRWRSLFPGAPALETPADSVIVQAVEALAGATAGAVSFGTEGPFFAQLGVETVIFGPGDIECAHQPDEFLRQERIVPTIALLRALIQRFCVEPN
jgi:acetylornithine deacetylase